MVVVSSPWYMGAASGAGWCNNNVSEILQQASVSRRMSGQIACLGLGGSKSSSFS